jgi:hypothetical protein
MTVRQPLMRLCYVALQQHDVLQCWLVLEYLKV